MADFLSPLRIKPIDRLQVEVSAVCNTACSYCAFNCYRAAWEGGLMEEETFERLVPEFPKTDLVSPSGMVETPRLQAK